ncbi:MAG: translation initiation factor IF-2 N-terminal domain-containing protein, partial [Pirellulaceae bacterium]|nr:translation initiation factor IF-2 N-terminal domain-containing protein [Pirellulaceae bacterium]
MPIRIYSLAKELGIENKELVDVCAKVGIHGKGSALASLTDEEVSQVKSHLSGESAPAAPKKATEPIRPATPPVQRPAVKPPVSEKPPAARAAKDDMFSRHRGPLRDLTAKAKARSG